MERPSVVLFVSTSIDGRITLGPNLTMFDVDDRHSSLGTLEDWKKFEKMIRETYQPQVWMDGSNMLVKEGEPLRPLDGYKGNKEDLYQDFLPKEVVDAADRKGWLAVVDGRGRFRNGYKGEEGLHIIHFVSHAVSVEYLAFLQEKNIPYLISGEKRVDLRDVLRKLKSKLGVTSVVTSSGGRLAGALLREGLLDEVNIRINPVVIGGFETPSLFDSPELNKDQWPDKLELIMVQVERDGHLLLRYRVN